jgi:hypothetical protein
MTTTESVTPVHQTHFRIPRRMTPELCVYLALQRERRYPKKGAGNAGCPCTRSLMCKME